MQEGAEFWRTSGDAGRMSREPSQWSVRHHKLPALSAAPRRTLRQHCFHVFPVSLFFTPGTCAASAAARAGLPVLPFLPAQCPANPVAERAAEPPCSQATKRVHHRCLCPRQLFAAGCGGLQMRRCAEPRSAASESCPAPRLADPKTKAQTPRIRRHHRRAHRKCCGTRLRGGLKPVELRRLGNWRPKASICAAPRSSACCQIRRCAAKDRRAARLTAAMHRIRKPILVILKARDNVMQSCKAPFGWAYDTSGAQIPAGDMGTPEPSTFALSGLAALALGAKGLRARREARKKAVAA